LSTLWANKAHSDHSIYLRANFLNLRTTSGPEKSSAIFFVSSLKRRGTR
jgi:hypothetical protein